MSGVMKCSPIYLENIPSTIKSIENHIFSPLHISNTYWTSDIGSVGKKPVSGDIDLAVDVGYCDPELLVEHIKESGFEYTTTGGAIANIAFPIEGTQKGEYVQVDIFPTTSLEFTKFARFSPTPEESKYSGGMRCDLLGVLIKYCSMIASENHVSYISLKQDGAYRTVRFGKDSKTKVMEDKLITNKPEELLEKVFGRKYNIKHFNSVESILAIMFDDDFDYKHIIKDVLHRFVEIETKKGREVPEEVNNYD